MKGIRIDRLEIRLKGIPFGNVKDSMNGLGSELMSRLSKDGDLLKRIDTARIDRINSGAVQTHGERNGSALREMIVDRITGSILQEAQRQKEEK